MAKPKITTIPATLTIQQTSIFEDTKKRRTAAYARVSTDQEEQETSFTAQVDFYTKKIKENKEWEFVYIYTDEGISAVNTKRREGFNRMVSDALDGKIDLIITKSVSRFARNTVDSLSTIRKLKEHGTEVYFEKENIWTFDGKGELLITIMSSLAQEESRSISENVSWGKRRSFEQGNVYLPYAQFLGYERGEDGRPKIVEAEAEIVRHIYSSFLHGMTVSAVTKELSRNGTPTPSGSGKWRVSTVSSILRNEKYKGEAILQKTVGIDFLQKSRKKNEGEAPQYHVTESHEAIISPEIFDLVQEEFLKRRQSGRLTTCAHPFSSRVICGECGGVYGTKSWRSSSNGVVKPKKIWQCNEKYRVKGNVKCKTPHLTDSQLEYAFVTAFNRIVSNKEQYIADYEPIIDMITGTTELDKQATELAVEQDELQTLLKNCIDEKARFGGDERLNEKYNSLLFRYDSVKQKIDDISLEIQKRQIKRTKIEAFLSELRLQDDIITNFDEDLWRRTAERIIVHRESEVVVEFRDGRQIKVNVIGR